MEYSETDNHRVDELLSELSSCREDERASQNQLIQVIMTAGTLLGVLTGFSYFKDPSRSASSAGIDYGSIIFWLSLLIFGTTFAYILVLGIGNVLRYYHIQDIETRLYRLIPSSDVGSESSPFLHWNSLSGPIITRNWNHLSSLHGILYFLGYTVAACCAVAFGILMVCAQYLNLPTVKWYDRIGFWGTLTLMLIAFMLFVLASTRAKAMVSEVRQVAVNRLRRRAGNFSASDEDERAQAKEAKHLVWYLLYPKRSDPQKPLLIVLGFLAGLVLTLFLPALRWDMIGDSVLRLLYCMLVFDYLAYQARYQINDMRGISEDNGRFIPKDCHDKRLYVLSSTVVALLRVVLAVLLTATAQGMTRYLLVFSLLYVLLSTFLYELARTREWNLLIFILVGACYPLRFFLGLFAATPRLFSILPPIYIIPLWLALWAYGSCASILSWCNSISPIMKEDADYEFPKQHFIRLRNVLNEGSSGSDSFTLGQSFPLTTPWNLAYLAMLFSFWCGIVLCEQQSLGIYILNAIAFLCLLFAARASGKMAALLYAVGLVLTAILVITAVCCHIPLINLTWILLLCFLQLLCVGTTIVLRYRLKISPITFGHLLTCVLRFILSDTAIDILLPSDDVSAK